MIRKSITLLLASLTLCASAFASTEANKQLVVNFYTDVIINAQHEKIDQYVADGYIQHNPTLKDGKEALRNFVKSLVPPSGEVVPSSEIVRVIAEDDLVVLHVKHYFWPGKNGGAIVDIFRVEDGLIAEHWDVIQAIPETSANDNTMF